MDKPNQPADLKLVDNAQTVTPKREIEAYHILPSVRQQIADEFRVMKSTRRLAKKYRLPRAVVQDIVALHLSRKEPAMALRPIDVFARRTA